MTDDALNAGLDLAMAFGVNWLQPIQIRLAKRFPEFTSAQLDRYDEICRKAMQFGHEQVIPCWRESSSNQKAAFDLFRKTLRARFPWISDANLERLFSQGCYYAWKDGEI